MEQAQFSLLLEQVFACNGLSHFVTERSRALFFRLYEILLRENAKYNLTAITTPEGVCVRHFADSLLFADRFPADCRVLDVGCGGGFPTLPLAICRPDLSFVALDATAKKVAYVTETARELGLSNVSGTVGRAEELCAVGGALRESFLCVTARAVAALPVLAELCLPAVHGGGVFLAMKGPSGEAEWQESKHALQVLGADEGTCEVSRLLDPTQAENVDDGNAVRTLLSFRKIAATPRNYPRAYGQIKKKPL